MRVFRNIKRVSVSVRIIQSCATMNELFLCKKSGYKKSNTKIGKYIANFQRFIYGFNSGSGKSGRRGVIKLECFLFGKYMVIQKQICDALRDLVPFIQFKKR